MEDLTPRQTEILSYIKEYRRAYEISPSQVDIMRKFGFASRNAVARHIEILINKGYLKKQKGLARSIVPVGEESELTGAKKPSVEIKKCLHCASEFKAISRSQRFCSQSCDKLYQFKLWREESGYTPNPFLSMKLV